MLMSVIMMSSFILLMLKTKKSWESTIILINVMNITTLMIYPFSDSAFMVSNNYMLDSMSVIMLSLTMWITAMMLLSSFKVKVENTKQTLFIMVLMLLLTALIMTFLTSNMLMFYVLFESSLIPTMMLIIMWGHQSERKTASLYIILYTIIASLPMLMMFMKMLNMNYSMSLIMKSPVMPLMNQYIMLTMMMSAFLVKLPMFLLHLWLPKAHVEAPLAGSMILAAILLKLGGYGLMRMNKMLDMNVAALNYFIISISSIGAIITNIMCLRQTDLKSLIAYSSIGHMSLLIIGVLSNSKLGQYGSMIIMLTHGLTSSSLFLLSNIVYEKMHTRNIMLTNGLMTVPMISMMWMLSISSNMALPPMLNIIGEVIVMMTSYFIYKPMMCLLMMMMFSTSLYSLYLYTMVNHGNQLKLINPLSMMTSINLTSITSHLWPLVLLTAMPMKMMLWC